jgi:hypothetical protein
MLDRSTALPANILAQYFSDDLLKAVDSEDTRSTYTYECGCIVARFIPTGECTVQWCGTHNRLTAIRST